MILIVKVGNGWLLSWSDEGGCDALEQACKSWLSNVGHLGNPKEIPVKELRLSGHTPHV
jgi:hypothetical protein